MSGIAAQQFNSVFLASFGLLGIPYSVELLTFAYLTYFGWESWSHIRIVVARLL